jgi:hypothetical protein
MLELDHIAVACETLDAGRAWVEDRLGVTLSPGGKHTHFGTHNMLLGLSDGIYLEVIAIDPDAGDAARPRWFDLDRFSGQPRLGNWICRSDDLDADLTHLPGAGTSVALMRGDIRWRMAVPSTGVLPFDDCHPAIMQWDSVHPATRLPESGCTLTGLTVSHPDAETLAARIDPLLDTGRVRYVTGAPALTAMFDTPLGQRTLA